MPPSIFSSRKVAAPARHNVASATATMKHLAIRVPFLSMVSTVGWVYYSLAPRQSVCTEGDDVGTLTGRCPTLAIVVRFFLFLSAVVIIVVVVVVYKLSD